MNIYPYNLDGLYHALVDTADVWRLISERGCHKEEVPLLRHFEDECPCCEFAVVARRIIKEEVEPLYSRCSFCPMAGAWEGEGGLGSFLFAPCARGLFGDWQKYSPDAPEAKAAAEISKRAGELAEKVLRIIETSPEDETL